VIPALLPLLVVAQLQPLPPSLIPLDSDEGRRLLVESKANRAFFALSSQFLTQRSTAYCGVASGVMALNALPIQAPEAPEWAPFRAFTQDNVFNDEAVTPESVARGGLTLAQLTQLLRANHAEVETVYASDSTLEAFRAQAASAMASANDFVLVDFLRGELGQDTGAHWSPLAAYHQASDRFLVLDVARFRYPPYWARAEDLFRAMNTRDLDAGRSRGWLVVRPARGAPPRAEIPSMGHRIWGLVAGAATGVFLLGAAVGAGVMAWRRRSPG
jgi:hypothetical protein